MVAVTARRNKKENINLQENHIMKKLITLSLVCLLTSILFSSCSKMTIAKRHYNNGYYVDLGNKKKKQSAEQTEENKVVQIKTTGSLYSIDDTTILNPVVSLAENNVASSKKNAPREVILKQDIKQALMYKIKIIESSKSQLHYSRSKIKKLRSLSSENNGLSLFWIIILVLLILWVLGLAGGLGGFINLLLLVALILLILWLLRVI